MKTLPQNLKAPDFIAKPKARPGISTAALKRLLANKK